MNRTQSHRQSFSRCSGDPAYGFSTQSNPVRIVNRSRTVIAVFRSSGLAMGSYAGKNRVTGSDVDNRPAPTARPARSETTLLVTDCIVCGWSGDAPLKYSSTTRRP